MAQALLYAQIEGVTLGKLTQLVDFTGSGGLIDELPTELRKPVEALDKLALTYVALDLVAAGGVPTIRTLFVTVGFPNLRWKVWNDDLVVDSLGCRFTIFDPLRPSPTESLFRAKLGVLVSGVLSIEGVPLRHRNKINLPT